ncbi:hypothetical protein HK099_003056 [Clydaea vesicula]|uniref:SMAD/FHA domain-containing protein n=1 Tax=Clydaea vesicula TaxID=447962 RepID=A0AAD5U1Z6_9FUNG|nr:hypothetical protein HK099_003056 [Clydaea vesicula]
MSENDSSSKKLGSPLLEEVERSANNSADDIQLNNVLSDRRQSAFMGFQDAGYNSSKNNGNSDTKPNLIRLQLIPWSTVPMIKPVLNELVERRVKEGQTFRVGRQVQREGVPASAEPLNPLDVWFTSKVVSRAHAEFSIKDGLIWIRDIGSSSGTFINKNRLSPTTKESKPFQVKEGDIIQFGVDYKGKPDDIYKSITIRIGFYDQSWVHERLKKSNPLKFRNCLISLLNSTKEGEQSLEDQTAECCICFDETGAFQALFIAPCSHCYHYKCVAAIIVQSAMFQCPLCRQVANLTASVSMDNLHTAIDENEVAIGAKGDPNAKYAVIPQILEAVVEPTAVSNEIVPKKRRSSFTARISTFLGRRSSTTSNDSASASPQSNPNTTPQGTSGSPLRNSVSASPFQPVTESSENNNVAENELAEEGLEVEAILLDTSNEPNYVATANGASSLPLRTHTSTIVSNANNIPRSTTVNTFEDDSDVYVENNSPVVNIPGTINEV